MKRKNKTKTDNDESNEIVPPPPPFFFSNLLAKETGCDLSAPNWYGIGNILVYSRLIEEFSLSVGRPIKLLTAPLRPSVGVVENEEPYPIWKHNPFIAEIINAEEIDADFDVMRLINNEMDNFCHFNHMIENICANYGLKPRKLRPSIYLSPEEMAWGLNTISHLPRPVICIHPGGTSSVFKDSPWFSDNWEKIIKEFEGKASFVEISKRDLDHKNLSAFNTVTTLRQAMALIWASDIFIGFDSGPSHIATAFEKPSFILWNVLRKNAIEEPIKAGFGPATMLRWAYPQNRNAMLLGETQNEVYDQLKEFLIEKISGFSKKNRLRFNS
jgi:hypothetical protein